MHPRERLSQLKDSQTFQYFWRGVCSLALIAALAYSEPQHSRAQTTEPSASSLHDLSCKDYYDLLASARAEVFGTGQTAGEAQVDPAAQIAPDTQTLENLSEEMVYGTDATDALTTTTTLTTTNTATPYEWQLQALNRVLGDSMRPEFKAVAPISTTVVMTLYNKSRVISYTNELDSLVVHPDTGYPISFSQTVTDTYNAGKLVKGPNLIDANCNPREDHGHVSEEVSVILGHPDEAIWSSPDDFPMIVLYMKILNYQKGGLWGDVIDALLLAGKLEADIINLSLTGPYSGKQLAQLEAAANYAVSKGVLIVVAAGNENLNMYYPNCLEIPSMIRVVSSARQLVADELGNLHDEYFVWPITNTRCIDKPGITIAIPGIQLGGRDIHGNPYPISGSSTAAAQLSYILGAMGGNLTREERLEILLERSDRLPRLIQNTTDEVISIRQYQFDLCGYRYLCDHQVMLPAVSK